MNGYKQISPPLVPGAARSAEADSPADAPARAHPDGPSGSPVESPADPILQTVERLGSLGDPTRVRILLVLDRGEFNVGELCAALRLPQSTVSRHLRLLTEAGWASVRNEATSRWYRRAPAQRLPDAGLWQLVRGPAAQSPLAQEDAERAVGLLQDRQERSRDFFRGAAGRWDALRRELFGDRIERQALWGLLDPAWHVADLGCGTGVLTAALAPWVTRVTAIDREPEMLEEAARRLGGGSGVAFRQGDLEALPLEEGEVDAAFALLVFHLLPDPLAALSEALRVLRPGGILVILDMRAHAREDFQAEMGHLWAGFSPDTLVGWMCEGGFEGVRALPLPPESDAKGPLLFLARGRKPLVPPSTLLPSSRLSARSPSPSLWSSEP